VVYLCEAVRARHTARRGGEEIGKTVGCSLDPLRDHAEGTGEKEFTE